MRIGHLEGREIESVRADRSISNLLRTVVLDLEPDRLNALVIELDAEDCSGFLSPRHGGGHPNGFFGL
jgi:hypothetical protein